MIGGFNCINLYKLIETNNCINYSESTHLCLSKGKVSDFDLSNYIINETIVATKIQNEAFPVGKADIFISHSHNDYGKAKLLKKKLNKIGVKAFLDSDVWLSADTILKEIDNKYCLNDNHETYNYRKRNLSTSYVHILLADALMQAIDSCNYLFFLNTSESLSVEDSIKNQTNSPWIYYELSVLKYIQKKKPRTALMEDKGKQASIESRFEVDISKLPEFDLNLLNNNTFTSRRSFFNYLDSLFDLNE